MIVFMGLAGSGKSVQGRMLADKFGFPWLSTGEFLRMLISGQKRRDMIEGKLLSDEEVISLIQKTFSLVGVSQEFVLDGFPRTTGQADWMLSQINHGQLKLTCVVYLEVSPDTAYKRLLARGRQDDKEESIAVRLKEHEEIALPILDMFKKAKMPIEIINGEAAVEEVHQQIIQQVKTHIE